MGGDCAAEDGLDIAWVGAIVGLDSAACGFDTPPSAGSFVST